MISLRRRYLALAFALLATAAAPLASQRPEAASCVDVDTTVTDYRWPSPGNADSVRRIVESLERQLATATEAVRPRLLLELGRAKAVLAPDAQYARAREKEFFYNEVAGDFLYTGWHFEELIKRFPASDLVDDAAYEATLLPLGGECEGYIACYVHAGWRRVADFLAAHPRSEFADDAAARGLLAFLTIVPSMDLRGGSEYVEPPEIRKLVVELDSLGRALGGALGARFLTRAGELWQQMGEYDVARAAYQRALSALDAPTRACVRRRVAAIPRRSFALEAIRVIHSRRVELTWPSTPGATGYVVHRSTDRSETGPAVGLLPSTAVGWIDTTTTPGTTHWYRVIAATPHGPVESIPAAAEVPTLDIRIETLAVSTSDRALYLFGALSNGYPQVLRVTAAGTVERLDGINIGSTRRVASVEFRRYTNALWLSDASGIGVLRFSGSATRLPEELRAVVRRGIALLGAGDGRDLPSLLVSVDEERKAAWVEGGGGRGPIGASAMDCIEGTSLCWIGGSAGVQLRAADGATLATAIIPSKGAQPPMYPRAIFADPTDSSAWVVLRDSGRLLHIDRSGAIKREVQIVNPARWYSLHAAADLSRRELWFVRRPAQEVELLRVDLNTPDLRQRATRLDASSVQGMAPDLSGGLWLLVQRNKVMRVDGLGRPVLVVDLSKAQ